jgi:hypothetical protein
MISMEIVMLYLKDLSRYNPANKGREVKKTLASKRPGLQHQPSLLDLESIGSSFLQQNKNQHNAIRRLTKGEDRRKICQRTLHQPVMHEFRSRVNRRKQHQREDDMVVHISVKA